MSNSGNQCVGVVVTILSLLLGFVYVFSGLAKLTPIVGGDVHQQMVVGFVRMAPTFPLTVLFGIKIDPVIYRLTVGITEVIAGILLAIAPGNLKKLANIVLFVIMGGAVYTHIVLGDGVDKTAPPVVLAVLLLIRLYGARCAVCTESSSPANPKKTG